jgi:hypothetical protein
VKEYSIKAASGNTGASRLQRQKRFIELSDFYASRTVTRVFCGNCGSAITHLTAAFGDAQAIQTGNFADFANIPITTECEWPASVCVPYNCVPLCLVITLQFLSTVSSTFTHICSAVFVKDRWTGLAPIAGAAQAQTMS